MLKPFPVPQLVSESGLSLCRRAKIVADLNGIELCNNSFIHAKSDQTLTLNGITTAAFAGGLDRARRRLLIEGTSCSHVKTSESLMRLKVTIK